MSLGQALGRIDGVAAYRHSPTGFGREPPVGDDGGIVGRALFEYLASYCWSIRRDILLPGKRQIRQQAWNEVPAVSD